MKSQKEAFDRIQNLKNQNNDTNNQKAVDLEDKIKQSLPSTTTDESSQEILNKKQDLDNAVIQTKTSPENKEDITNKVTDAKNDFDQGSFENLDPGFKQKMDDLFNGLQTDANNITNNEQAAEVNTKLNDLIDSIDNSKQIAKLVKDTNDFYQQKMSEVEDENHEKTQLIEKALTELNKANEQLKDLYGSKDLNDKDVYDSKEKIENLKLLVDLTTRLRELYLLSLQKINSIKYPEGTGNFGSANGEQEAFENYVNKLYSGATSEVLSRENIIGYIEKFNDIINLLNKQEELITKQQEVAASRLYRTVKDVVDAKNMADAILRSVPVDAVWKKPAIGDVVKPVNYILSLQKVLENDFTKLLNIATLRQDIADDIINRNQTNLFDLIEERYDEIYWVDLNETASKQYIKAYYENLLTELSNANLDSLTKAPSDSSFNNLNNKLEEIRANAFDKYANLYFYEAIMTNVKAVKEQNDYLKSLYPDAFTDSEVIKQYTEKLFGSAQDVNPPVVGLVNKITDNLLNDDISKDTLIEWSKEMLTISAAYIPALYYSKNYYFTAWPQIKLSDEQKAPLNEIVDLALQKLKSRLIVNDQNYDIVIPRRQLELKYLQFVPNTYKIEVPTNGSWSELYVNKDAANAHTFNQAFWDTYKLQANIQIAQSWYALKDTYAQDDTMKAVFEELNQAIQRAIQHTTETLEQIKQSDPSITTDDQAIVEMSKRKNASFKELRNMQTGLLHKLKQTKLNQAKTLANNFVKLSVLMLQNNIRPTLEYSSDPDFTYLSSVKGINDKDTFNEISEKYNSLQQKYQQNVLKLYQGLKARIYWEHKWLKDFADLINSVEGTSKPQDWEDLTKAQLLKIMQASEDDLNSLNTFLSEFNFDLTQELSDETVKPGSDLYENVFTTAVDSYMAQIKSLDTQLQTLNTKFISTLNKLAREYSDFKSDFAAKQNNDAYANYFTTILRSINKYSDIESSLNSFKNEGLDAATISVVETLSSLVSSLANNDYTDTSVQAQYPQTGDQVQKMNNVKEKLQTLIGQIYKNQKQFNNLVYGANDNANSLVKIYKDYTETYSNFGLLFSQVVNNISPYNIYENSNNISSRNPDFSNFIKNSYKEKDAVKKLKTDILANWQKDVTPFDMVLKNIESSYDSIKQLRDWIGYKDNLNEIFSYLDVVPDWQKPNEANYNDIVVKEGICAEDIVEKWNQVNTSNVEDPNEPNPEYDYASIKDKTEFLDLFNKFNILKSSENQKFNLNNVDVQFYKAKTDSQYIKIFNQTDGLTKKIKFNLRFIYKKPEGSSSYPGVDYIAKYYDGVTISVNTLDEVFITQQSLGSTTKEKSKIFDWNKAGWNAQNVINNYVGAFAKYSLLDMAKRNIDIFSSEVKNYGNINNPESSTNSREDAQNDNLKVKLKLKDDFLLTLRKSKAEPLSDGDSYKPSVSSDGNQYIYWTVKDINIKKYSEYVDYMIKLRIAFPMVKVKNYEEGEFKDRAVLILDLDLGNRLYKNSDEGETNLLTGYINDSNNYVKKPNTSANWMFKTYNFGTLDDEATEKTVHLNDGTTQTYKTQIKADKLTEYLNMAKAEDLLNDLDAFNTKLLLKDSIVNNDETYIERFGDFTAKSFYSLWHPSHDNPDFEGVVQDIAFTPKGETIYKTSSYKTNIDKLEIKLKLH
ncbi:hypothetical protein [Mycoplasma sp. 3341]|uniref:hypothetical protein n=1 Tax=Mycoplasma sp. 3341 TaxID=3447506 RepID=UPI003F65B192